jgi:pimeloyl-ACP methyl ester carboxylesterase
MKMWTRKTPALGTEGIAALEAVQIGGIKQWLLLRGTDRRHPALLFLHGGPGGAQIGFARQDQAALEERFVVVNWDQRGAGLSYSKEVPRESMHLEQMLADAREVIEVLRKRFDQDKIYLVGHSYGSLLGMMLVQRHPELFHGYFGISQVVHWQDTERLSYEHTLRLAREAGHEQAVRQLEAMGQPPWNTLKHDRIHQKWLEEFGGGLVHEGSLVKKILRPLLFGGEYRLGDLINWMRGQYFSVTSMQEELRGVDFYLQIPEVQVPVAFCIGRHDYTAPFELGEWYFEHLQAPDKKWLWFEDSAHSPNVEQPEKFQQFLLKTAEEWRK